MQRVYNRLEIRIIIVDINFRKIIRFDNFKTNESYTNSSLAW